MRFGYSDTCLAHDPGPRHPESSDRLRAIREGLKRKHGVEYVAADPADFERVGAIHDRGYLEDVRTFCAEGGGSWDPDTTAVEMTWDAALQSAGLACWAAREAVDGADGRETPFSLGRPPGHHAVYDDAMGFCFINNVAVAAQYALDELGCERVAIFDWDVHHGNGTQDIFYDRADVHFSSIHEGGLYPATGEIEETGEGDGEGTTLNVPMPSGSDDTDYMQALDDLIVPGIERFGPDLLLVSAGFDAHRHDPISRVRLSTEAYALMTDRVRKLDDTPLAFVLEGGYGLEVLAESVAMVHETFDGRQPMAEDGEVSDDVGETIDEIAAVHDLE